MGEDFGIATPRGFFASGVACGIKDRGRDLAIIYSEEPALAAGVFTTNLVKAAPVQVSQKYLQIYQRFQAIVANSGCANACTGEKGIRDAEEMVEETRRSLGISEDIGVLVASTGLIGAPLPLERIKRGIKRAVANLKKRGREASEAIMTTDTFPKEKVFELKIGDKNCFLAGMAKGSGMIEPEMATMLAFVTTDISVEREFLQASLREAVEESFNLISVDGEMSTNDTVFVLANGLAQNEEIKSSSPYASLFRDALKEILLDLAKMIVKDGEGATKFVIIKIEGAPSREAAKKVGRRLSRSPLLKAALFGEEVNWGRIMSALGSSGVDFNPERIDVYLAGHKVVENGCAFPFSEEAVGKKMREREIEIRLDLKSGKYSLNFYTTDLSLKYIEINSSYRS
jgi:glutamate N-acetyltransferase/amino-acid N-acetyltransferase